MSLLDKAVRKVAQLDEPLAMNYCAAHLATNGEWRSEF